eukprot:403368540
MNRDLAQKPTKKYTTKLQEKMKKNKKQTKSQQKVLTEATNSDFKVRIQSPTLSIKNESTKESSNYDENISQNEQLHFLSSRRKLKRLFKMESEEDLDAAVFLFRIRRRMDSKHMVQTSTALSVSQCVSTSLNYQITDHTQKTIQLAEQFEQSIQQENLQICTDGSKEYPESELITLPNISTSLPAINEFQQIVLQLPKIGECQDLRNALEFQEILNPLFSSQPVLVLPDNQQQGPFSHINLPLYHQKVI